jgi:hypothetical protein
MDEKKPGTMAGLKIARGTPWLPIEGVERAAA